MEITINRHSSIRIQSDKIIYFDPYLIEEASNDADIIFITHDHMDHFSIEDIAKVEKEDTVFVIPDSMYNLLGGENVITIKPYEKLEVEGYETLAIPSYNREKKFHTKDKGYLGYVVAIEGQRVYVAGDCDMNEDNLKVNCDIALVPIGGHYTMDHIEAAEYINRIKPKIAIPEHYGDIVGAGDLGEEFKKLVSEEIRVEIKL